MGDKRAALQTKFVSLPHFFIYLKKLQIVYAYHNFSDGIFKCIFIEDLQIIKCIAVVKIFFNMNWHCNIFF